MFLRTPFQRTSEGLCTHLAPPDIESVCRALKVPYDAELLDHLELMQRTALPIVNKAATDKPRP